MAWTQANAETWAQQNLPGWNPAQAATGGGVINAAKAAGKFDQLNQAVTQANNPTVQGSTVNGVVPMTVEPLHQWEKSGLSQLGSGTSMDSGSMSMVNQMLQQMASDPSAFAAKYTNPMATQFMTQAGTATQSAMNPITMQEIQGAANPFADALKARLSESAERARAGITAAQGMRGARSFGDSMSGARLGELDREVLAKGSDIDYNSFNDARTMLENMRNRDLQAGGQFGNLATGAQGITNSAMAGGLSGLSGLFGAGQQLTDQGIQAAKDKMAAGEYIRTYNQGVNDMIGNDMLAEQGDSANKMSQVLNWLREFQSNTTAGGGANTLQQAGGAGQVAGGLLSYLGQGAGNYLLGGRFGQETARPSSDFVGPMQPLF